MSSDPLSLMISYLLIVGYVGAGIRKYKSAYKVPVANITASINQQHNSDTPTKWTELTAADHWCTTLVPSSYPPVILGGDDTTGTIPTADIKMYDNSNKSWKKIGSLSSARSRVAVAAVYNNAIMIIGGCTKLLIVYNTGTRSAFYCARKLQYVCRKHDMTLKFQCVENFICPLKFP